MSIKPEVLDALLAAGATAEMIVAAVKADLAQDEARREAKRANNAERQRRFKARHKAEQGEVEAEVTRDNAGNALPGVTRVAPLPSSPDGPSSLPHTPTQHPLYPPPTNTSPGDAPGLSAPRKKSKASNSRPDYHGDFEMLWVEFPRNANSSKKKAYEYWLKLDADDRERCFDGAMAYAEWLGKQARPPPTMHLTTFINERRFDTLLEAAE